MDGWVEGVLCWACEVVVVKQRRHWLPIDAAGRSGKHSNDMLAAVVVLLRSGRCCALLEIRDARCGPSEVL